MSLLSWLFPPAPATRPADDSSGLSRIESTRPVDRRLDESPLDNAQPANRKGERMARRELLYAVVRESMTRSGVLASSFKFKVLSLDARGRQFLIMVDLARDHGAETARLAEIEAMIAQAAKLRHDIVVTAVYWRMNEHVAIGDPLAASRQAPPGPVVAAAPAPAPAAVSQPVPPLAARADARDARFDPIQPDEMAAFKKALASGGARAKAFDGSARHGPQSYTLLTGFEDTELSDADLRLPALSGSQYGDLR